LDHSSSTSEQNPTHEEEIYYKKPSQAVFEKGKLDKNCDKLGKQKTLLEYVMDKVLLGDEENSKP
jgi:hypothetical protein